MHLHQLSWVAASWFLIVPVDNAQNNADSSRVDIVQVKCAGDRHFLLRLHPQGVEIVVDGRSFELSRRPSSLGYYRSRDATLIIDGDFVAFVPRGDFGWQNCHIERPWGSSPPDG